MNKQNFFYIIESGTNRRAKHESGFLIIDGSIDEEEIQRQGWLRGFHKTEKMTIADYEWKFGVD